MKVGQWLIRLFGGRLGELEELRSVQEEVVLMALPAEREFAGKVVRLREIEPADRDRILSFARALPEHDLLFLRRDITQPEEVDSWLADVASGNYSTVVALVGDELVGYATVAQDGMTWTRHVGELRLLVAPALRGVGLGSLLIDQAFAIAKTRGLQKIVAQMTVDQEGAINGFERLGFRKEAVLRRHVIDRNGELHDLQIMAFDAEEFAQMLLRERIRAAASVETSGAPF
ncbi:MAG: GNAT family N-acetyltransferase [Dehalococcoidia bacterium]|nr:GNAT family N-acetyltransferase [Dehalococcoidia bacterium]MCA9830780.1 GNAT family N-acetyltransferase [Dehalococcoidia bacterium]MCB9484503.1 GNAT family N-acetyltransferase [Thermoflexaceae bacterium]